MMRLTNYPDNVTEADLDTPTWRCIGYTGDADGCNHKTINDDTCCQRHRCWHPLETKPGCGYAPDHCRECCQL